MNPFTLEGKTVLVTGASSGIGRATAILCSQMGAEVLITGRNESRLKETLESLEGTGHKMFIADLTEPDGIAGLIEWSPTLDGFVNNAGIIDLLPVDFITKGRLDRILAINTYAPIQLFTGLSRKRKFKKGASVVFTSSVSGNLVFATAHSLYSVSKAAVTAFAKNAALEMASRKIRVNSVCPGMIETELAHAEAITPEMREEDVKRYPLKRYGQPEEVAGGIVFLLSEASSFITGINLLIDGGLTLR